MYKKRLLKGQLLPIARLSLDNYASQSFPLNTDQAESRGKDTPTIRVRYGAIAAAAIGRLVFRVGQGDEETDEIGRRGMRGACRRKTPSALLAKLLIRSEQYREDIKGKVDRGEERTVTHLRGALRSSKFLSSAPLKSP